MGELHVIINPDGSVNIDAQGYTGTKCMDASKPYEKSLGTVQSRKKKPEMLSGEGVRINAGTGNRIKNKS